MKKVCLALLFVVVTAATASALEYTAVLLLPPNDVPINGFDYTSAYALNKRGQVFGRAGNNHTDSFVARGPVLWTGGVPQRLPVPAGFHWYDAVGVHFLNDAGTVVSTVEYNEGTAGDSSGVRPIIWRNGAASILPLPTPLCAGYVAPPVQDSQLTSFPMGLNSSGHVLISACNNFWIWNGSTFQILAQPAPVAGCYGLGNAAALTGNRLNDADHVTLDRRWVINTGGCPLPQTQPGIFTSPTTFVPFASPGFTQQINKTDQVLLSGTVNGVSQVRFWNGSTSVDLGAGTMASLNNLGQVAFLTAPYPNFPRLYKNGVTLPLTLPAQASGTVGFLLNDYGQIAGTQAGFPERAVILTPVPALQTLTVPALLTGCKTGNGTVALEFAAPAGGVTVALSATTIGASVPTSITFAAGVAKKTFKITTAPVNVKQSGNVTASIGTEGLSKPLAVRPIGVQSLVLSPNPVQGGAVANGTVTLECNAGPGNVSVALLSSAPTVAQPTSAAVTILQGTTAGSFSVATTPTAVIRKATISAKVPDALSKAAALTVTP